MTPPTTRPGTAKRYWEAARWKAGDGTYRSAEEMAERLKLDPKMTRKAWDAKMAPEDPNAAFGKRMFESLFSEAALDVKAELGAAEEFLASAEKDLKGLPKDAPSGKRKVAEMAVQIGEERYAEALAKERVLPHEADAYESAGRVAKWGKQGLAGNPRVRVAEEVVESVRVRVRVATEKTASLKLRVGLRRSDRGGRPGAAPRRRRPHQRPRASSRSCARTPAAAGEGTGRSRSRRRP